jgi:hypothetical protein
MTTPFAPPAPAICDVVERWHQHTRGELPGGLDELVHDDLVLDSPALGTAQPATEIVTRYLTATGLTFPDDRSGTATDHAFDSTNGVIAGDTAVLEFETSRAGIHVNGFDIIGINQNGRIVEFPPPSDPVTTSASSPLAPDPQAAS